MGEAASKLPEDKQDLQVTGTNPSKADYIQSAASSILKATQDFTQYKQVHIQKLSHKLSQFRIKKEHKSGAAYWSSLQVDYHESNLPSNWQTTKDEVRYGLAGALWAAYNNHSDVVLTPDDFWITIELGFSAHVNNNAKKFRHYFVSHKGKKNLEVFVKDNPQVFGNWAEVAEKFQHALSTAVKADAASTLECDFSTTGPIEKTVSRIGTMSTFKTYFTYICFTMCGIRSVYFAGTLADWKKVRDKVETLKKFECEAWINKVLDVLDKFIETYQGKVDLEFWNKVAHIVGPDKGSGRTVPALTGWITALFPYTASGKPTKTYIDLPELPESIFSVPFILDVAGVGKFNYEFKGGFTGLFYENEAFRPQLTYAVMKQQDKPKDDK